MLQALLPAAIKYLAPILAGHAISGFMGSGSKKSKSRSSRGTSAAAPTAGAVEPARLKGYPTTSDVKATSSTVSPPSFTAPLLGQAASEAQRLYSQGAGFNPYPYARVAPLSDQTRWNINNLGQISSSMQNPYTHSLMSAPLQSVTNLSEMASGGQIGKNPYFNEALQHALGKAATNIDERMSSYGRYGSGAHTEALASELGGITANALANQYNMDVNRMLQANQLMQQGQLGQMQGIGQLGGAQGTAATRALQGSSMLDQYNQALIDADRQRWGEEQSAGWNRLGAYTELAKTLSGNYGATTGTTTEDKYGYTSPLDRAGQIAEFGLKLGEAKPWDWGIWDKLGSLFSSGAGSGAGGNIGNMTNNQVKKALGQWVRR